MNKNIFEDRYTEGVEFSGGYITSGDEFFVIPDFDDVIAVLDAINNPTAIPEWEPEDISVFNIIALFQVILKRMKTCNRLDSKLR